MNIHQYVGALVFVVIVGVALTGCEAAGDAAPPLAVTMVAPVWPTAVAASTVYTSSSSVDLGSAWAGGHNSMDVPVETEQIYFHYPQRHIAYDEVIVDDVLVDVTFRCHGRPYDVMDMFVLLTESEETPARYKSRDIDLHDGCHVEFTVRNTSGDTMGLSFMSHCASCYK